MTKLFQPRPASRGVAPICRRRSDLTRALLLNPELGAAYEARGRSRARQFKYDLAIADIKHYLRSGAGKLHDNHSEIQGYLLILRIQRLLWGLLSRWRR